MDMIDWSIHYSMKYQMHTLKKNITNHANLLP